MTLHQLEIFAEVGRRRNLTAAAQALRIAQPSISLQLRRMEQQVGAKLYSAGRQGIELTAAGSALLAESEQILTQLKSLKLSMVEKFGPARAAVLIVGATDALSTSYLPVLFARFRESHPAVQLKLRTAEQWTLAKLVLSGDLQLALTRNPVRYRRLIAEPFTDYPVTACVSAKHPLAKERRLANDALIKFGFVARGTENRLIKSHPALESVKRKGLTNARVVMECDSTASKLAAVKNQIGIGLLLRSTIEPELASGELVELALPGGPLCWRSYIIYHRTKPLPPVAADFISLLREYRATRRSPHA